MAIEPSLSSATGISVSKDDEGAGMSKDSLVQEPQPRPDAPQTQYNHAAGRGGYRGRGRGRGGYNSSRGGYNKPYTGAPRKEWHEHWKEQETYFHPDGYNRNLPITQRVQAAASDFARIRFWPREYDPTAMMSVREQWDQIQLYIGTLMNMPIWNRKAEGEDSDSDSDENAVGSDSDGDLNARRNVRRQDDFYGEDHKKPLKSRPPYANYATKPTVVRSDEEIQDLLLLADIQKGERLSDFCDHPEKAVAVFLSSYLIEQGLVYSDRFLFTIPRILRFFLNYLIRNDVFDGRADELNRALKIVDTAIVELLLTAKLAKAVPGPLGTSFMRCFNPLTSKEEEDFTKSLKEKGIEIVADEEGIDWTASTSDWAVSEKLVPLPKDFAATHTTGVVETSTRRITAIHPPVLSSLDELERMFTQVVLSPWDDMRVNSPVIEEDSVAGEEHNPWKDDIVILVQNESVEVFKVGMGIAGTFVQIVSGRYWFVRQVMETLTSYHVLADEVTVHPEE